MILIAALASMALLQPSMPAPANDAQLTARSLSELCGGDGLRAAMSETRVTEEELALCGAAGMAGLAEIDLGGDGIVLARARGRGGFDLDLRELYLAAAAYVPDQQCVLVPNEARNWNEVGAGLPRRPIRFYGPPAGSGARDSFVERALMEGARQIDCLAELERRDPEAFERAVMPRHDQVWLDSGENDAAVGTALLYARDAIGIFGWRSFRGLPGLEALSLGGVRPNEGSLEDGSYPLASRLYLYAPADAMNDPAIRRLLTATESPASTRRVRRYGSGTAREITVETPPDSRVRVYKTQ